MFMVWINWITKRKCTINTRVKTNQGLKGKEKKKQKTTILAVTTATSYPSQNAANPEVLKKPVLVQCSDERRKTELKTALFNVL